MNEEQNKEQSHVLEVHSDQVWILEACGKDPILFNTAELIFYCLFLSFITILGTKVGIVVFIYI